MIQNGIVALLGKGGVRDYAVPILRLVLGEGAASDLGMIRKHGFHVGFIQLDEGNDLSFVRFVNVGKAHPLAVRRKGKVVVRKEQLAVGRAVCPAVELHFRAVFVGEISDDGLFGDHALCTLGACRRQTFGQGARFHRHDDLRLGLCFQLLDLLLQSGDLLIFLFEFVTGRAVLLRLVFQGSRPLCQNRQTHQREHAENKHHAKDHVCRDQHTDPRCHQIH